MKKPPEDMIPFLTLDLSDDEKTGLEQARPLVSVGSNDQDLVTWIDDAVETGVLKVKPRDRKTRAKSIAVLSDRLYKDIESKQVATDYQIIYGIARRAVKDETGEVQLTEEERASVQKARAAGPMKDDREDAEWAWIDPAVETGIVKTDAEKQERRRLARTIRITAERLLDEKVEKQQSKERQVARELYKLAEKVAKMSCIIETDLRSISRERELCETTVYIADEEDFAHAEFPRKKWLVFGQGKLRLDMNPPELMGYLPVGVTDFEHDSGYAIRLPLIGIKFEGVDYHSTRITAYIAPRALDDFAVPWPGYNPMEHPETVMCGEDDIEGYEECRENPHPMIPEGFYTPYNDPDLYREVEGRRVMVRFSVVRPDDEDGAA